MHINLSNLKLPMEISEFTQCSGLFHIIFYLFIYSEKWQDEVSPAPSGERVAHLLAIKKSVCWFDAMNRGFMNIWDQVIFQWHAFM